VPDFGIAEKVSMYFDEGDAGFVGIEILDHLDKILLKTVTDK
jgi:hypothetical protein